MDHSTAQDFKPIIPFAHFQLTIGPRAANIDFGGRLCKWEMRSAETKLYVIDLMEFSDAGKVQKMRAYWGPENLEGDIGI